MNLPKDTDYTIEEQEYQELGYQIEKQNDKGTIKADVLQGSGLYQYSKQGVIACILSDECTYFIRWTKAAERAVPVSAEG